MDPVVSRFEIARPPAVVYAYITDPSRFPAWQSDISTVETDQSGPAPAGARFTTIRKIGPVAQRMTQEVISADPPRSWSARGVDGSFRAHATITVDPIDGGARSLVTATLMFEGQGVGKLLPTQAIGKMAARLTPRSYRKLTELLEQGE